MVNAKKLELIDELKELRIQKGITYQQIADETKKMGAPVSLSTIKMVFSDKHSHNHDYNNVLKPIADVLSPPNEDVALETRTLQTRLELKEEMINQLQLRLDSKEKKHKDRELFYMNLIEHLQAEISFKNEQIRHHNEAMDRKDATIKELYNTLLQIQKQKEE